MMNRTWVLPDPLNISLVIYGNISESKDCASRKARDAVNPTVMLDYLERARVTGRLPSAPSRTGTSVA
jgi:hypothetical protein